MPMRTSAETGEKSFKLQAKKEKQSCKEMQQDGHDKAIKSMWQTHREGRFRRHASVTHGL